VSAAVAIGDARRLAGYGLAGASVHDARTAAEAEAAWESLADDAVLLLLTPDAHDALAPRLAERRIVWAVVPS
jgi:vacuolar-type H+-ATPase subunit F/Vma7